MVNRSALLLIPLLAFGLSSGEASSTPIVVYENDFDAGEATFNGATTTGIGNAGGTVDAPDGFDAVGDGTLIDGDIWHNSTGGNFTGGGGTPGAPTILKLSNLPIHDRLDIDFTLLIIDSWDSSDGTVTPDVMNVLVDGRPIFSETFANSSGTVSYADPDNTLVSSGVDLGFEGGGNFDRVYDSADDSKFSISHTGSDVTIEWVANGAGWQGRHDESWGMDNLGISVDSTLTIDEIVADAVDIPPPGRTDIFATFTPNFGLTLTEAADIGGYDHFNWYQIAIEYPGPALLVPSAPFVDPLRGITVGGQRSDNLPFYWDEEICAGCDPELQLSSNISANDRVLSFSDAPGNTFIPLFGPEMLFTTSLVGVREDNTFDELFTFLWSSSYNPLCENDIPYVDILNAETCDGGLVVQPQLARNTQPWPEDAGTGGILDVRPIEDLRELPLDVRMLMVQDGGQNIPLDAAEVAEPSALSLFVVGLLGMGLLISWYQRRDHMKA